MEDLYAAIVVVFSASFDWINFNCLQAILKFADGMYTLNLDRA